MNNDLVKALRCLASQDENGDCNMDRHNFLRKENEPKMYCNTKVWGDETMQCPYYQDKYETCFEDGECGGWMNEVADIFESHNSKVEQLKERIRKYESGNIQPDGVYMVETGHGRRCIDVQDVLKIINEIFERKE